MIPRAHITAWRAQAPWPTDAQVEQDLVICRALTEMYGRPAVGDALAFRGGTALHKLHLPASSRYSEYIDLVQVQAGPIGPLLGEIRAALDSSLGGATLETGPRQRQTALPFRHDVSARAAHEGEDRD